MEAVLKLIQGWDLHPVVDHFTIGILIVAVAADLVGNLLISRAWIRYMAVTLMVLGALAAGASFGTGILEAKRVWPHIGPGAKQVLHLHAELGKYLAIVFGILALWRLLIQALAFVARTRAVYLVVAVLSCVALFYQGSLGGELVYQYGVGTALMSAAAPSAQASPTAKATPEVPAGPLPTVSVPTPATKATPTATAAAAGEASASTSPSPEPTAKPTATPTAPASPSPTAQASASTGT